MYKTDIHYIFPSGIDLEQYNIPGTATEENTEFRPRDDIIK